VEPHVVEAGAQRGDAPVHHVARGDGVGARLGVDDRGAREQGQGGVVHHVTLRVQHAAVAVAGVFAEADIGPHQEIRQLGLQARMARGTMPSGA
jgi:hypothetical protein